MSNVVKLSSILVVALLCASIPAMLFIVGEAKIQSSSSAQEEALEEMRGDLNAVLENAGSAVSTLAQMPEIIAQAQDPLNPENALAVDALVAAKNNSEAHIVFMMDANGTIISCTPLEDGSSLTGNNYAYRPYFHASINGTEFLYPAVGATTGIRGLFHSYPIIAQPGAAPIGVAIIKMGLEQVDGIIGLDTALFLSPDGIVFSASNPDWLYKAALPINTQELADIEDSQQFASENLTPLAATLDGDTVTLDGVEYSVDTALLAMEGWSVVTLKEAPAYPLVTAIIGTVAMLGIGIVILIVLASSSKKRRKVGDEIYDNVNDEAPLNQPEPPSDDE